MTKVKLIGNLAHDGVSYKAGDTFEGDKAVVDNLIALGAARDPKAVEPDLNDTTVGDAQAEAAKIVEAAEADAEKIVAEAKAEAAKLDKASQEAAAEVVADAKAEAESIISDAQAKSKEAAAPKAPESNPKATTDSKSK
jgi:vacuolar-type H+-ATPase subunit H